jgi:tripeptide aminopeptidase
VQQQPLTTPLVDFFLELCAIPSPPGEERAMADRVARYLASLGIEVEEDDAGERIGSTSGNLLARLAGTNGGGTPIFLCAHLDTVPVAGRLEPYVDDGGIARSAGETILGADDKAAVAVMLEAARRIVADGIPHSGVELLFTPMEEVGLRGAKAFDAARLEARVGFVYDQAAPIGEIVLGAPHARTLHARFHGRAAHAGMYPEDGRSAIQAAARAIADLRLGRIDETSSANVGLIDGGTARNVVPEWCALDAEVRSHDPRTLAALVQEMLEVCAYAASVSDCSVETRLSEQFSGYRFRPDDLAVRIARTALQRTGYEPWEALTGGGADANVFNEAGLSCVNLANGMAEIHSPDEHIAVADLEAMVEVTLGLVEAARGAA